MGTKAARSASRTRARWPDLSTRRAPRSISMEMLAKASRRRLSRSCVDARSGDDFTPAPAPGQPAITVPAGNYMPGVPRRTFYSEARWAPAGQSFSTAFELRYSDRIYASDANADIDRSAPYSVVNWRIVFVQRASDWRVSEFLRIENLVDKRYV